MKGFLSHILKPTRTTLAIFAIVAFPLLMGYVWLYSFTWVFPFGVAEYMIKLSIALILGLGITMFLDKRFRLTTKYYFIISITELILIWIVAEPIRKLQINKTYEKADQIIVSIEKFKNNFGAYPTNLIEVEQRLLLDIPELTYIGTRYIYEQAGQDHYYLSFVSYHGYEAHYDSQAKHWIAVD
jgi:hypothetical protein